MIFGLIAWLVVGLAVGFAASRMVNLRGDDPRFGIAAACGGAVVAALLYTLITGDPVLPQNVACLLTAAVGAVIAVVAWHAIRSRSISHASQTSRRSYSSTGR